MPYRDEDEVLRERYRTLEGELSQMKEAREVLAGLDAREAKLREEMATLTEAISRTRRTGAPGEGGPLLANLRVASPCPAKWSDMVGDERTRFCGGCKKNVHNISALDAAEAEALLAANAGDLCVRYYQRADGTVMTQDCPDGVRRKRNRKLAVIAAGAFGLTATAFGSAVAFTMGTCPTHATMGESESMGSPLAIEISTRPSATPPVELPPVENMGAPALAAPPDPPPQLMGRVAH
jgi:hypothetical protein